MANKMNTHINRWCICLAPRSPPTRGTNHAKSFGNQDGLIAAYNPKPVRLCKINAMKVTKYVVLARELCPIVSYGPNLN